VHIGRFEAAHLLLMPIQPSGRAGRVPAARGGVGFRARAL